METEKTLQESIFEAINGLYIPQQAEEHFLGVMSVRMGTEHKVYKQFLQILADPLQQWNMLRAPDNHELKNDFNLLCRILVRFYVSDVRSTVPSDCLLFAYFSELEARTQTRYRLLSFDQLKYNFLELQNLEKSLINRLLNGYANHQKVFSEERFRQILSCWLMCPQAVYDTVHVAQVVSMFKTAFVP